MKLSRLGDHALAGKRVLIREDFNVPMRDGGVANDARIVAALPTIRTCIEGDAAVIVMSHLGRPGEGDFDPALSLAPVAKHLERALGQPVPVVRDWHGTVPWRSPSVRPTTSFRSEDTPMWRGENQAFCRTDLCSGTW